MTHDPVNNPSHYTSHPSGVECLQITRHMGFNLGNATKYIWRADLKNNAIEDLEKAVFYLRDEIELRKQQAHTESRLGKVTAAIEAMDEANIHAPFLRSFLKKLAA